MKALGEKAGRSKGGMAGTAMIIAYIVETPNLHAQLQQLKTGDTLTLPGGYVRRVRPMEFTLVADNCRERSRWGTRKEIEGDTRHFLTTGFLPKAQGGRW